MIDAATIAQWNRPGGVELAITAEQAEQARQQLVVTSESVDVYEYNPSLAFRAEFTTSANGRVLVFFKRGEQWFVKRVLQLAYK